MQLINHKLFIGWSELEALGVPEETVRSGCLRFRRGKVKSWVNMADPLDGRRCLVCYESIPSATVKSCGLPSLSEMKARYEAELKKKGYTSILSMLNAPLEGDVQNLRNYRVMREIANPLTGEVSYQDQGGLPEGKITEYLQQSQWLRLIAHPIWEQKSERQRLTGKATQQEAVAYLVEVASELGVKLPSSYRQLSEKLKAYQQEGVRALIHASFGNRNAEKVDERGEALLLKLAMHKNKASRVLIADAYNRAASKGKVEMPISYSTVNRRLSRVEIAQATSLNRDGLKAFTNSYSHNSKGKRPSYSDALWNIDGTKHNETYVDANGQVKQDLKMVVVMDCYSDCFIGWHFGTAENIKEIGAAMRMAMEKQGVLPDQMMSDNDSSNQKLFKNYTALHFHAMANHGQSKYIERAIGLFQERELRHLPSFTGMNITAKGARSRVNDANTKHDWQKKIAKSELPTIEEAIAHGIEAIRRWNHTPDAKGVTRWQKYLAGKQAQQRKVTDLDYEGLFYQERKESVIYTQGGIILQRGKERYHYEVYASIENGLHYPDLEFHTRYATRSFVVREDIHHPESKIGLYLEDDKGGQRFIAWAHPKVEVSRAVVDHTDNDKKQLAVNIKAKKEHIKCLQAKGQEALQVAKEIEAEDIYWTSKDAQHAADEELMEELMGLQVASTESEAVYVTIDNSRAASLRRIEKLNQLINAS